MPSHGKLNIDSVYYPGSSLDVISVLNIDGLGNLWFYRNLSSLKSLGGADTILDEKIKF